MLKAAPDASRRCLSRSVSAALALMVVCSASSARAGRTVYFSYEDDRYLLPGQTDGAAAFIPDGVVADRPTPVAIILHGTNSSAAPHVWLGGAGRDLRPTVEGLVAKGHTAPLILAGPSQTRSAGIARELWTDFDLQGFVTELEHAVADHASIDTGQVLLIGHSGAGCNPSGGIASGYAAENGLKPAAIVAIDPCLDAEMGSSLLLSAPGIPLMMFWQNRVWPREPVDWFIALSQRPLAPRSRRLDVEGLNPHDAIVPLALAEALKELLPPPIAPS